MRAHQDPNCSGFARVVSWRSTGWVEPINDNSLDLLLGVMIFGGERCTATWFGTKIL